MNVTLINVAVCVAVAWVCLCRLDKMDRNTMRRVRAKYALLLSGTLSVAGLPVLFNLRPTWSIVIAAVVVLGLLLIEMPRWRHGPPRCCWRRE